MFIKNLLLIKQYDEAERHIIHSDTINYSSYNLAQFDIYNGILQEKKYHNNTLAEQYYLKGIREISNFGYIGNEFEAYGYFGLSRISKQSDDNTSSKLYLKKAIDLADFKNVDFN